MPPSFLTDPLMYQAVSDGFLPPVGTIPVASEEFGMDFESEVCVVTDDVPMGVTAAEAAGHVRLVCLVNDVSLRNLIPAELGKGFGFLQGKPRSALSPVMVTPDELGDAWRDGKLHLPLLTWLNGERFGAPEAGEDMQFSFHELIAHAAKTRPLAAGTIIGSGTVANQDESRGASCMAEKRMLEIIRDGQATTPFLSFGATVRIEMLDRRGATSSARSSMSTSPTGAEPGLVTALWLLAQHCRLAGPDRAEPQGARMGICPVHLLRGRWRAAHAGLPRAQSAGARAGAGESTAWY
jgi:fumarylacetoacetate (FAA) hydrolase